MPNHLVSLEKLGELMRIVMYLLGVALMLNSLLVFLLAKGSIHEVYASVLLGSGAICVGLGAVISRLDIVATEVSAQTANLRRFKQPEIRDTSLPAEAEPERMIMVHRGHNLYKTPDGIRVGERIFTTIPEATAHIDSTGPHLRFNQR